MDENKNIELEVFTFIHDDERGTGIFDDIEHALIEQIETDFNEKDTSYFFIALVESKFIETNTWEGIDYDIEHDVSEIKTVTDFKK
ncbi:hypothetical protein D3C80_2006510 [compost metagenome]